jgi:hypothetical protein
MTNKALSATLTSMEEEIKILKAQIKGLLKSPKNLKSLSDMEGFWMGKANFSWEDIQKIKTKVSDSTQ